MTSSQTLAPDTDQRTTATTPADLGLLVLRLGLGAVMIAHGAQKFFSQGVSGVQQMFTGLGVPLPAVSATGLATLELVGGALLVLGAATRVVGGLFAVAMAGAIYYVHGSNGFFAQDGGYEFVLLLAVLGLVVALTGAGRLSVDALLGRRRG